MLMSSHTRLSQEVPVFPRKSLILSLAFLAAVAQGDILGFCLREDGSRASECGTDLANYGSKVARSSAKSVEDFLGRQGTARLHS